MSWAWPGLNGAHIELGRGSPEELLARIQRFTATLSQLTHRYADALQSVDLRYPNGYALRVRGVTTLTEDTTQPASAVSPVSPAQTANPANPTAQTR